MKTGAFIGLGAMGAPMAGNLIKAGMTIRVWNRSAARCAPLVSQGATACGSIAEAVRGADFVVSIVADDIATAEVMLSSAGVVASAAPGTLIIDCSTNTPGMVRQVAQAAKARGVHYLDAPVSGSVAQSAGRELVFMVGGDAQAFERAQPVFAAMGRMSRLMGESGSGATIKLINNMLSGTLNAAIGEAMAVAEASGLKSDDVRDILAEGAAASRLTRTKIPKIIARDFSPQFQLGLMEKDLRYFLALAQEVDRPVPIASTVRSQIQAARRASLGQLDVSAMFLHASGEKPKT
jgi:3-hydroxyisobutyrate dehydrogenase-like beta-hydroxyacid dehydrogenase